MKTFYTIILLLFISLNSKAEEVHIKITGLSNAKGNILLGLFTNNDQFQADEPVKRYRVSKKSYKNGTVTCKIDLNPGTYGFAMLDDLNNNDEMDKNFFGIPLEGYGFSGYRHSGLTRPTFDDFKFTVKKGSTTNISIVADYF